MFTHPAATFIFNTIVRTEYSLLYDMCSVRVTLTINFVGNDTTGYLWSVLSQLPVPVGQILIRDLPLNIKNLRETRSITQYLFVLCSLGENKRGKLNFYDGMP